jgi:putative transcriptional regulator
MSGEAEGASSVLRNKRDATRYQILVQIAERQPAVSQQEIADAIGITSQAVSDYLRDLIQQDYVRKHGRGRYEITKEGVDWLISQTDQLRGYVRHVSEDVIGEVEVETALATAPVGEGQTVSLSMRDGVLRATPGGAGNATAVAVTDAEADRDVGITNFEGVVDYEPGRVTIVSVPRVREGGSRAVDRATVAEGVQAHDLLAVAGTEALAAARAADVEPEIRFGSPAAVQEAAIKGLDVLLLATTTEVAAHTNKLSEENVSYEVVDAAE